MLEFAEYSLLSRYKEDLINNLSDGILARAVDGIFSIVEMYYWVFSAGWGNRQIKRMRGTANINERQDGMIRKITFNQYLTDLRNAAEHAEVIDYLTEYKRLWDYLSAPAGKKEWLLFDEEKMKLGNPKYAEVILLIFIEMRKLGYTYRDMYDDS